MRRKKDTDKGHQVPACGVAGTFSVSIDENPLRGHLLYLWLFKHTTHTCRQTPVDTDTSKWEWVNDTRHHWLLMMASIIRQMRRFQLRSLLFKSPWRHVLTNPGVWDPGYRSHGNDSTLQEKLSLRKTGDREHSSAPVSFTVNVSSRGRRSKRETNVSNILPLLRAQHSSLPSVLFCHLGN